MKKDLTEFSDVVQNETAHIVSATATTIRDRAPQLVGSIVDTVNTVLLVDDTTRGEEQNEVPITAASAAAVCANRSQVSSLGLSWVPIVLVASDHILYLDGLC